MDVRAVKESLGKLNTAQLAQLRNSLLSQDVESIGLSADQALGLLQAIEERDTRDAQPNFVPSQPVQSFPVAQQPAQLDMSKVVSDINRLFSSAFGSHGRVDNSLAYQPASELSAITERVQMLEMQRQQLLNAQKQDMQSAMGWTEPDPKRRMLSNDVKSFNDVQGFQGNWMQGANQISQMNQSGGSFQMNQPRAQMNQSGGALQMNQPRTQMNQSGGMFQMNQPRAQMNQSEGGGPEMNQSSAGVNMKRSKGGNANERKTKRIRKKTKQRQKSGEQRRGSQRWKSPGRPQSREDSYRRRTPDEDDYYNRRSRSRDSGGRNSRENSRDRSQSYNRWSDDGDRRDDGVYGGRRREGSKNRDRDSHERRYQDRDDGYGYRSNDDDNRSYQDESQPYPDSPRGDGYYKSESNDFQRDDQFDDRHNRKRKRRDFDEGSWHAVDRRDQDPPRRYSPERDYQDKRFSDGEFEDQPRREVTHSPELHFDYDAVGGRSRERDNRIWKDVPQDDSLVPPIVREERWPAGAVNTSMNRQPGPDQDFFLRQGELFNPDMTQVRYREGDVMANPPERRNLDLTLGRIQAIPLSVGLGGHRHLLNQPVPLMGAQLPGDGVVKPQGFQRGLSGPALPSKDVPLSARMQGFVMRNQANKNTKAKSPALKNTAFQTKGEINLVRLLLRTGMPDKPPVKKDSLEKTKEAAGSVAAAGTPTNGQIKGNQAVSGKKTVAGKTVTNKPRPTPLNPEANSIGHQCDILEGLELQGFLYHRVMTLWTCYICRAVLKNGMAYKIHLTSKNHHRTLTKLHSFHGVMDRQKIAFALRNLPNHRTVSPKQLSAGNVNRMYFCCECGEGYSCTEVEHRKTERHLTLEAYRKCCNLCNVYCNDMKSLVKHQNGKLHITMKAVKKVEEGQVRGSQQSKTPISGNAPVAFKGRVAGATPVSSKASYSSKTLVPSETPLSTKALKPSKAPTSYKSSTLTKELSSDMTDGTAPPNISGLQSERKSIKVTLKGNKTPEADQSSKKDGKVEKSEDLIGLDLLIAVTGFFCRCCSKFYNNKHMTERNHCLAAEHKQKALAWLKSHGTDHPVKKPRASSEGEDKKPTFPQTKPSQSETIIIIDDDDDDVSGTPEKQQPPSNQDKMDTSEPQDRLGDKAKPNTTLTDSKLTPGAVNSKDGIDQVPAHEGKKNESSKITEVKEQYPPASRPVLRDVRAVKEQHKSSKDSDLEDGEILSDGEVSVNEQHEASVEVMETKEQSQEKIDAPIKKTEALEQTIEGTAQLPSGEVEAKTTDPAVQVTPEPSSETIDAIAEDQAMEEKEEPSDGADHNVKEDVEPPITEMEDPAADPSVEVNTGVSEMDNVATDQSSGILEEPSVREIAEPAADPGESEVDNVATDHFSRIIEEPSVREIDEPAADPSVEVDFGESEVDNVATDQSVGILEEPSVRKIEESAADPSVEVSTGVSEVDNVATDQSVGMLEEPTSRELEEASDVQNSDKTSEPLVRELDIGTTDPVAAGNTEASSGEVEIEQDGEDLLSGGVSDLKDSEQLNEKMVDNLATADKDIDLAEEDLYADLVEHVPEGEDEDNLESGDERFEEDEEVGEDEDDGEARFFIDEGTWEVRSEEDGSDEEPFLDDGILQDDDDEVLMIIGDEEDSDKDVEDKDTAS